MENPPAVVNSSTVATSTSNATLQLMAMLIEQRQEDHQLVQAHRKLAQDQREADRIQHEADRQHQLKMTNLAQPPRLPCENVE